MKGREQTENVACWGLFVVFIFIIIIILTYVPYLEIQKFGVRKYWRSYHCNNFPSFNKMLPVEKAWPCIVN